MPDLTIALLDDDPLYSEMLRLLVQEKCPWAAVTCSQKPEISTGHDIFIIDNDFGGSKLGGALAEEARAAYPDSMVVVLSAALDPELLKTLVNCHASAVFDKGDLAELERLFDLINRFAALRQHGAEPPSSENRKSLISSIAALLAEWNMALAHQQTSSQEALEK